jgi:hypothetical protein
MSCRETKDVMHTAQLRLKWGRSFVLCNGNCLSEMTSVCDASASGFSDEGYQWGQLET